MKQKHTPSGNQRHTCKVETCSSDNAAETGAEAIVRTLSDVGYRYVFCVPGGYAMLLEAAANRCSDLEVVQCHDERHAGSMAEGCIRSGVPAVLLTITGPGLTGASTAIANARQEGTPIFHLGAEVSTSRRHRGAAQHIDTLALMQPLVKEARLLSAESDVRQTVLELVSRSRQGHPGPVYLGVPLEVAAQQRRLPPVSELTAVGAGDRLSTWDTTASSFASADAGHLAELLGQARYPVLLLGYGVRLSGAHAEVRALLDCFGAARVVTSPRAVGEFPRTDPKCLGVVGLAGDATLPPECDLLVVLGSRLREHTASPLSQRLQAGLPLVHVDIESEVLGGIYPATFQVAADIGQFLRAVLASGEQRRLSAAPASLPPNSETRNAKPEITTANDIGLDEEDCG